MEPQIRKTPARLRYKKEPPRFEPHLCQQLCRLCVTWWELLHQQKRGDVRRVTFEVGSCFCLGGFPPPFLVEILYQQLQSARDWQTWAKMAPLRNKSEKSDYSFKSSNENKQLGRVHCVISHFPVELEDLQSRKSAEIL